MSSSSSSSRRPGEPPEGHEPIDRGDEEPDHYFVNSYDDYYDEPDGDLDRGPGDEFGDADGACGEGQPTEVLSIDELAGEDEVDTASTEHPRARAEAAAAAEPPAGAGAEADAPDEDDAGGRPRRFYFDDFAGTDTVADEDEQLAKYAGVAAAAQAGGDEIGALSPFAPRTRTRERSQKVIGGVLVALVAAAILVVVGARLGGSGSQKAVTGGPAAATSHATTKAGAKPSTGRAVHTQQQPTRHATSPAGRSHHPTTRATTKSTTKPTTTHAKPTRPATKPTGVPKATAAPLTVLNNTTTTGLAGRAAQVFSGKGWHVDSVANYTGSLPTTTVFYDQGDKAEEQAARNLAAQFPQITSVQPRISGLPGSGLTVVLAPNWG